MQKQNFHFGWLNGLAFTPYSNRVKSALNASAQSVMLSSLVGANGWWYTFGRNIFNLLEERQSRELRNMLLRTFIHRLPVLQDLATHYGASAATESSGGSHSGTASGLIAGEAFMDGMDAEERERKYRIGNSERAESSS
ncbi:hypothetical protein QFC19_004064 [Naganishia cerealis]|uniref:Uncharacterized protein n=1 Tax=Naganishia cerealis TaxID=610337 RepID=A0ACC2VZG3_9TREE|nr:hypothetical protein QFC19_004064 [Naganishia cerealis]